MCSVGALSTCVQVTMRNALQVHQTKMGVEMLKYISFNAISKFVQISTKNHLRAWKVSFFLSLKVEILFNFTQNQRPLSHVCLGAFVKLRNATIRFVMSVCPPVRPSAPPSAWNNSALTGLIFMKFDIWVFSKICRENPRLIKPWPE